MQSSLMHSNPASIRKVHNHPQGELQMSIKKHSEKPNIRQTDKQYQFEPENIPTDEEDAGSDSEQKKNRMSEFKF